MNDFSRGDVEFLAIELFHRENGDNRSWEKWDGNPSKSSYRVRAVTLLAETWEGTPVANDEPKKVTKRKTIST